MHLLAFRSTQNESGVCIIIVVQLYLLFNSEQRHAFRTQVDVWLSSSALTSELNWLHPALRLNAIAFNSKQVWRWKTNRSIFKTRRKTSISWWLINSVGVWSCSSTVNSKSRIYFFEHQSKAQQDTKRQPQMWKMIGHWLSRDINCGVLALTCRPTNFLIAF